MADKSVSIRNYALTALCISAIFAVFSYTAVNYQEFQNQRTYDDRDTDIRSYARCEIGTWATVTVESYKEDVQT